MHDKATTQPFRKGCHRDSSVLTDEVTLVDVESVGRESQFRTWTSKNSVMPGSYQRNKPLLLDAICGGLAHG